ncbi:MAG: CxxC-x17-CxxC domain-containing protein [Patescibacteria group bacterium]
MFNRNGGGSRGGFGDRKSSGGGYSGNRGGGNFGRRDSGDRGGRMEMHKAVCAECGNDCEVPFKPSGERPVLCSTCFGNKDAGAPRQSFSRDREPRDSSRDFPKPSFHSERHEHRERPVDNFKEQFEALNTKLDRVIRALEQLSTVKSAPTKETIKPEIIVKEAKKAEVKKAADKPVKKVATPKKKTSKK